MSCEGCKEHDATKELNEATVIKQVAKVDSKHKFLCWAVAILAAGFVVMSGCMVYTVSNAQRIANEAVLRAMETVAEMEVVSETTTTTVHQDTGEGDGNNVYLDGDNTEYNEAQGGGD